MGSGKPSGLGATFCSWRAQVASRSPSLTIFVLHCHAPDPYSPNVSQCNAGSKSDMERSTLQYGSATLTLSLAILYLLRWKPMSCKNVHSPRNLLLKWLMTILKFRWVKRASQQHLSHNVSRTQRPAYFHDIAHHQRQRNLGSLPAEKCCEDVLLWWNAAKKYAAAAAAGRQFCIFD